MSGHSLLNSAWITCVMLSILLRLSRCVQFEMLSDYKIAYLGENVTLSCWFNVTSEQDLDHVISGMSWQDPRLFTRDTDLRTRFSWHGNTSSIHLYSVVKGDQGVYACYGRYGRKTTVLSVNNVTSQQPRCKNKFVCDVTECIAIKYVCDGVVHCKDQLDESINCQEFQKKTINFVKNSHLGNVTIWAIVGLLATMSLCITFYRVLSLRRALQPRPLQSPAAMREQQPPPHPPIAQPLAAVCMLQPSRPPEYEELEKLREAPPPRYSEIAACSSKPPGEDVEVDQCTENTPFNRPSLNTEDD